MIEEAEGLKRYEHRAMATVFEILIADEDPSFAEGTAHAAFGEIDRLEQELSRYVANSDVARINNLSPHGSLRVSLDTFHCLRLSMQYWKETGGAFDVTLGALKERWAGNDKSWLSASPGEIERTGERSGMTSLELDEVTMTVRVHGTVPCVDLGAIGKGYAVDRAVALLKEWGVRSALVHGGTSSAYAFGRPGERRGWPVTLSDPGDHAEILAKIFLSEEGLGGSGIRKGRHIIDPRSGRPAEGRRAAWVVSESAARSDALSTACMVMTPEEIGMCIGRDARLRALVVGRENGNVLRFGVAA